MYERELTQEELGLVAGGKASPASLPAIQLKEEEDQFVSLFPGDDVVSWTPADDYFGNSIGGG